MILYNNQLPGYFAESFHRTLVFPFVRSSGGLPQNLFLRDFTKPSLYKSEYVGSAITEKTFFNRSQIINAIHDDVHVHTCIKLVKM